MQSEHFKKQIYFTPEFRQNVQKLIAQNCMPQLEEELNSFLATFNICTSVLSLRCQRNNGTVQNVAQYGFIYAALKDEVLNPCRPSVACDSVSGWHFRENIVQNDFQEKILQNNFREKIVQNNFREKIVQNICASLDASLKRKRSESQKTFMDKTSCKKARLLAQSAPIMSRGLGLIRPLVECPTSRDAL